MGIENMENAAIVATYGNGFTKPEVIIANDVCTLCKKETIVINDDSSGGEYPSANFCLPCLKKVFAAYKAGTLKTKECGDETSDGDDE